MINKHKVLAIIPARKNSKGLKNKNKLKFNKKPLFFWPLNAAIKSKYVDRVVLSSDDKMYLGSGTPATKKYIFQERKSFDIFDFADEQFSGID